MPPGRPIVVVDDDPELAEMMAELLRDDGMEALAFRDAAAGLDYLRSSGAAVIVVDYLMPGMNGCELLAAARVAGCDAPAILMTAARLNEVPRTADVTVLLKPFGLDEMLALVHSIASSGSCPPGGAQKEPRRHEDTEVQSSAHASRNTLRAPWLRGDLERW